MNSEIDDIRSDGRTYASTDLQRLADRIDIARSSQEASITVLDDTLSACDPSRADFFSGLGCQGAYQQRQRKLGSAEAEANAAAQAALARAAAAQVAAARAAEEAGTLPPLFPWPPPTASAWYVVPNNLIVEASPSAVTLSTAANQLKKALDAAGYSQTSFYSVPGGFAIVTEMERIQDDATPIYDDRWRPIDQPRAFSLAAYLKGLLYANPGRFRMIAFIISDEPFRPSSEPVTAPIARSWTSQGNNVLPPTIGGRHFDTASYACTALVYEFKSAHHQKPAFLSYSLNSGWTHLVRSGIWASLQNLREHQ